MGRQPQIGLVHLAKYINLYLRLNHCPVGADYPRQFTADAGFTTCALARGESLAIGGDALGRIHMLETGSIASSAHRPRGCQTRGG